MKQPFLNDHDDELEIKNHKAIKQMEHRNKKRKAPKIKRKDSRNY